MTQTPPTTTPDGDRRRLPQPLYESLPYLYCVLGVAALAWSYARGSSWIGGLVTLIGLVAVVGGAVLILRRRDFRQLRDAYRGDNVGEGAASRDSAAALSTEDSTRG